MQNKLKMACCFLFYITTIPFNDSYLWVENEADEGGMTNQRMCEYVDV